MPKTETKDIEIEQMVRWLCTHWNHWGITTDNFGFDIWSLCHHENVDMKKLARGSTLREALCAACDRVRELEGANAQD